MSHPRKQTVLRPHLERAVLSLPFALIAGTSAWVSWPRGLALVGALAAALTASLAAVGISSLRRWLGVWIHWAVGAALAIAPLGGWIAVRRSLGLGPVVLAGAVVFWTAGFDIIDSCARIQSDRDAGVFTLPARWGARNALVASAGSHVLAFWLLALFGQQCDLGWLFLLGVVVSVPALYLVHRLVRAEDLSRARVAAYPAAIALSLVLLAFTAADAYWRARAWPI